MKPIQMEDLIARKLEGIFNLLAKRQVELGSCSNDFYLFVTCGIGTKNGQILSLASPKISGFFFPFPLKVDEGIHFQNKLISLVLKTC